MHVCCAPSVPLHLMSLGRTIGTWVGSGTGPGGSLTVVVIFGSVWAMAKPAALKTTAATETTRTRLMAELMDPSQDYGARPAARSRCREPRRRLRCPR